MFQRMHDSMIYRQTSRVFAGGGAGPLGVEPTCILRPTALDTLRCPLVHGRRARSTFLHKKRVPRILSSPAGSSAFPLPLLLPRVPGGLLSASLGAGACLPDCLHYP